MIDECDKVEAEIKRLASLRPLDYQRERRVAAKKLGIGVVALDAAVKRARGAHTEPVAGQGRPIELVQIVPWPEDVSGSALLTDLSSTLRRYVIISDVQGDACALWSLHTHAHDASDVSPKLVLKSPQKRSGKSRTATALARTVARPLHISGIKPAALLRLIEMHRPTLLLDEVDAAMKQDREMAEALRGIINSGFDRVGAKFILNVPLAGGGYEPREFSTWAPQLLSGIGKLPDTVRDRAIEIEMIRKRPSDLVKRLRRRDGADLDLLGRKSARWVQDNFEKIRDARPMVPDGLDDRAADAWEPLLAIAHVAGGDWPERARKAALVLSGNGFKDDDEIGTLLLTDIRDVFAEGGANVHVTRDQDKHITSEKLVVALVVREERPWAEFGIAQKPITKNRLASLLRGYKIKPGTVRIGSGEKDTAKGYKLFQFVDAFQRWLPAPPLQTVTTSQPNNDGHCDALQNVTSPRRVTVSKSQKVNNDGHCDGVTVSNGESGSSQHKCDHCQQYGGTIEVAYDDAKTWLHRECMDAWRAAYDELDVRNQPFYRPEP